MTFAQISTCAILICIVSFLLVILCSVMFCFCMHYCTLCTTNVMMIEGSPTENIKKNSLWESVICQVPLRTVPMYSVNIK